MKRLGLSRAEAIGHLHLFWWWCLDYAPDGNLAGFDADEIALAVEWEDEPDRFLNAMIDAGFIDVINDTPCVHDWIEYGGKLLKRKQANRERMREARATHESRTETPDIPDNNARAEHVPRTDVARAANVQSQRRGEERREELTPPTPSEGGSPDGDAAPPKLESIEGGKGKARKRRTPKAAQVTAYTPEFETFWAICPRKDAKREAFAAWSEKLAIDPTLAEVIPKAMERAACNPRWYEDGGRFCPMVATWLNNDRYLDQGIQRPLAPSDGDLTDEQRFAKTRLEKLRRRDFGSLDAATFNGFDGDRKYAEEIARLERILAGSGLRGAA
jgi:hypothetical protein